MEQNKDIDTAARFKRKLSQLGIRQKAFAEEIGMEANTVSRWATGVQQPPGILWAYLRLRLAHARSIARKRFEDD